MNCVLGLLAINPTCKRKLAAQFVTLFHTRGVYWGNSPVSKSNAYHTAAYCSTLPHTNIRAHGNIL